MDSQRLIEGDKGISSRLTRQNWVVPAISPTKWSYYTLKVAAMKSEMAKHDQISWWFSAFLRRKANKLTTMKVWSGFPTADQGCGRCRMAKQPVTRRLNRILTHIFYCILYSH